MSTNHNSERYFSAARSWVVKIGSALLTADGRGLDHDAIADWAAQVVALLETGKEVVIVSSGSVAEGIARLGWQGRPRAIHDLQAAAAVGQMGLVQSWESAFSKHGRHTAQILLTHADIASRERYLNAASALATLLGLGVVPIINENDTVAVDEIRLGDNDTLAAQVANLVDAEVLVLLTDQDGMFDADPRSHADARLISAARVDDGQLDRVAGGSGGLGRGGMVTKLRAARQAARSGTHTVIANGRAPDVLARLAADAEVGTWLQPVRRRQEARKHWLSALKSAGQVYIDEGAVKVLRESGRSLLPVGVVRVDGDFERGALVTCVAPDGSEIARGLVNYSADEARRIAGRPSGEIEATLGYIDQIELIHRDNLVLC